MPAKRNRIPLLVVAVCCVQAFCWGTLSAQDRSKPTIMIRSVAPTNSGSRMVPYGVTREDFRRIKTLVPTIQTLLPMRHVPGDAVTVGDRSVRTVITGTTHEYADAKNLKVIRGRFLTEGDSDNRNNVAVIDREHARQLFRDKDPIGEAIQFNREYFTVVGIVDTEMPPSVFIPLTTMRSRLGDQLVRRKSGAFEMTSYELSEIEVVVDKAANLMRTVEIIEQILLGQHEDKDYQIKVKP